MPVTTRLRSLLAVGITSAALTACERAPASGGTADSTATASAAPKPPIEWTVSSESFGPLRIGMTRQALVSLVDGEFTLPAPSEPGGCRYVYWPGAPGGVRLMFAGDTLVRIEADSANVVTADGARVGDSETRIDSLHGSLVRRLPHKYTAGRYLIVVAAPPADTLHRVVFETDGNKVTKLRAGRLPQVEWVEGCS